MDLDDLIAKLQEARRVYGPFRIVMVATADQVIGERVSGMKSAWSLPIADDSRLGDDSGEVESLCLVVTEA